jgi:LmeA-like phospholipid-binding
MDIVDIIMTNNEPRLEEQALSQAAEIGITNQLDAVDKINVDVRTDLLKMVQGKADSISVTGEGLVVQKDIRVHEMELHASDVAVDLLSALFGDVELNYPADATIKVVLTEGDLNRAMNSDFVKSKLPAFELAVENEIVTFQTQKMELQLRDRNQMIFSGNFLVQQGLEVAEMGFTGMLRSRTEDQPVLLEGFYCNQGQGLSLELAAAFMQKAKELVNLPFFVYEGTAFRILKMEVAEGKLTVEIEARVKQIPSL